MKYDKSKVKSGQVYPVKDNYLVFAGGSLRIQTEGITCFQDCDPYNDLGYDDPIPYAYKDHDGVDVRANVGTAVYAHKDITIKYGHDETYGNYVICNGRRMRHMNNLPTKTKFLKDELVFKTGDDHTEDPHLHIGQEDGGDEFATLEEGKNMEVSYDVWGCLNQNGAWVYVYAQKYENDKIVVNKFDTADALDDCNIRYYPGEIDEKPWKFIKCMENTMFYKDKELKNAYYNKDGSSMTICKGQVLIAKSYGKIYR